MQREVVVQDVLTINESDRVGSPFRNWMFHCLGGWWLAVSRFRPERGSGV